jgi:hypothetical protein
MQDIFVNSSNLNQPFIEATEAMRPCIELPQGKSFAVVSEAFTLGMLRDIADSYNVGKKAIVVLSHPGMFEVRRLSDGTSTKLFYKYLQQSESANKKLGDLTACGDELQKALDEYLSMDIAKAVTYDKNITKELIVERVISHTYLSRKLLSLAAFRHAKNKKALNEVIDKFIDNGILRIHNRISEGRAIYYFINEVDKNAS